MESASTGSRSTSVESREGLVAAMMEPSFYPKRPAEVTHTETHISDLFFAGDVVYKIKKPVRYSFADFSTLGRRRYFLNEELRLNRRLAPSVYLGVLPLACGPKGWHLGGDFEPSEYVLVMRRLPANRMLPILLERNLVTPAMMKAVADLLAPFHARAPIKRAPDSAYGPSIIQPMWEENLADVVPFVGRDLDQETFVALKLFGQRFVTGATDLLDRRAREGKIREVHGDLHCEHVCFAPEGIQIFDCIEFSPKLRTCDLASELAFLVMDLEFRGANELAQHFLSRYLELAPDPELTELLPFYKSYRALVRGKVEALQSRSPSAKASAYFDCAYRAIWEKAKPFLVLISGLSGSGKSTLARRLGPRLGAVAINSDSVRKTIARPTTRERVAYGEGIYSPDMTEETYSKMMQQAEQLIRKGNTVILEATFQRKAHRNLALRLASKHKLPLAVIYCHSPEAVISERLKRREAEGTDLSDATWEIYQKQKAAFERIDEIPPKTYLELRTDESSNDVARRAETFLQRLYLGEQNDL